MTPRNNVTRLLDSRGISYSAHEIPPEKIGAVEAASLMGVSPNRVFKTIVVTRSGRGKPILALVPGPDQVDLKALARALGEKKVTLPTERRAEQLTGLQAGGISPLALMHKPFDVVVDESVAGLEKMYLSGGQRGLDLGMAPEDLVELTGALVAPIRRR